VVDGLDVAFFFATCGGAPSFLPPANGRFCKHLDILDMNKCEHDCSLGLGVLCQTAPSEKTVGHCPQLILLLPGCIRWNTFRYRQLTQRSLGKVLARKVQASELTQLRRLIEYMYIPWPVEYCRWTSMVGPVKLVCSPRTRILAGMHRHPRPLADRRRHLRFLVAACSVPLSIPV
jgi:hypothetical protein